MLDANIPSLPSLPGVGYVPHHFAAILADARPVGWPEIHAENCMGAGGWPLAQPRHLAERFPISLHGAGFRSAAKARLTTANWRGCERCVTGSGRPVFPNIRHGHP